MGPCFSVPKDRSSLSACQQEKQRLKHFWLLEFWNLAGARQALDREVHLQGTPRSPQRRRSRRFGKDTDLRDSHPVVGWEHGARLNIAPVNGMKMNEGSGISFMAS